jgi:hypothetical protein
MKSALTAVIVLTGAACVIEIGARALGVQPKTRRDWILVALTITFLVWLGLMVPLR